MKQTRDNILVGIVITVAVLLVIVGSLWLARGGLSKGYPLYVRFPWGAGLKPGAPVWVSGAGVGYVSDVQFRADGSLLTELRIQSSQPIPRGSAATVVANGFFGDVAVNFMPTHGGGRYSAGDTVISGPPTPGVAVLVGKADSISTSVNALTTAINKELVAGGGLTDLRQTLAGTNRLVATLSGIAAEQSRQLSATMASLRRATSAVDSAKIDSTLTNLRATSANMTAITHSLDSTGRELRTIVTKVDSGNGTVAKLLNDPTLYNDAHRSLARVDSMLARVDSIMADLKKNPRRYLPGLVKVF
jgi:phospholipid/cholesterol/gamma-HCH transport system substrate-binding protein